MFNKLSTKTLLIIFTLLLVAVVIYMYYDSTHGERTFRSSLVSIDTADVTAIYLYPKATKHREVKLFKDDNQWKVSLKGNRSVLVSKGKVKNLITQLLQIKPVSVAAQNKSKWSEYNVDSSGTEVKVYEDNKNTLDLTIGKFTYQRPRSMMTYVRVAGDDNVYLVNGFVGWSFNHNANYFRDNYLINGNEANWSKVSFDYPADSSFQLVKVKGKWMINGKLTDSTKTMNYLNSISHLTNSNFVDNFDQSILTKPKYTVTINSSALGKIKISGYENNNLILLHSNENPDSYFNGKTNKFWQKLFIGKKHLTRK